MKKINIKNLIYGFVILLAVSAAVFALVFNNTNKEKWVEYHNDKYGYTVSYPASMTDRGVYGEVNVIYGDSLSGFAITASSTTASDISDFLKQDTINNFPPNISIIENETAISGLPAAFTYIPNIPLENRGSSLYVKNGNIVFLFLANGFDTTCFYNSIKFDK